MSIRRAWVVFRAQESFLVRFWTAFIPLLVVAYLIAWVVA